MVDSDSYRLKLRPLALRDLEAIWLWSAARWSAKQADDYFARLNSHLVQISRQPELHPVRPDLRGSTRLALSTSHLIAYRIVGDQVLVVRIIHSRRDWRRLLKGSQ